MTTTTLPADPRTLNCPSWCQTDHGQEWAGAVELDAEAARLLAEYPEHYAKVLGGGVTRAGRCRRSGACRFTAVPSER